MDNKQTTEIQGRKLHVKYDKRALQQISTLKKSVYLEMELNFSCLVKKRIFETTESHTTKNSLMTQLNDTLYLSFKAITTNVCVPKNFNIYEHESVEVIEIAKPERFVPDWVTIDFQNGSWGGEFGYVSNERAHI